MTKQTYRDLVVWQGAIDLIPEINRLVARFPRTETYALCDQMRRAAVSVPANIAEGQARQHRKEFLQHLSIARGSLAELHTLLVIAERLGYLSPPDLEQWEAALSQIHRPLTGLINRIRSSALP